MTEITEIIDEKFMRIAMHYAKLAERYGEVPIGAVVVKDGEVLSWGRNRREKSQNALCHAEIEAISKACHKCGSWRLEGCTLYVTHEPCVMCAGTIVASRIERVVYGSTERRFGAYTTIGIDKLELNHKCYVTGGVLGEECSEMLSSFFAKLRKSKAGNDKEEDINGN